MFGSITDKSYFSVIYYIVETGCKQNSRDQFSQVFSLAQDTFSKPAYGPTKVPKYPSQRSDLQVRTFPFLLNNRDLNEVIQRANATPYGLAAGVVTNNLNSANTLMRALRAGTVWINCYGIFDATIPLGGYKMSGIGREKGLHSLNNYLQIKAVVTRLNNYAWL